MQTLWTESENAVSSARPFFPQHAGYCLLLLLTIGSLLHQPSARAQDGVVFSGEQSEGKPLAEAGLNEEPPTQRADREGPSCGMTQISMSLW